MQELNSVLFTLPRIPCLYRIAMISGHTLYLRFIVCELVVHLTISGAVSGRVGFCDGPPRQRDHSGPELWILRWMGGLGPSPSRAHRLRLL